MCADSALLSLWFDVAYAVLRRQWYSILYVALSYAALRRRSFFAWFSGALTCVPRGGKT